MQTVRLEGLVVELHQLLALLIPVEQVIRLVNLLLGVTAHLL